MNRYRLTASARRAILQIWLNLAAESERSADAYVDRIVCHFRVLADYPSSGKRREELGAGYRSVAIDDYIVLYRLVRSQVFVMQVVHKDRDRQFSTR